MTEVTTPVKTPVTPVCVTVVSVRRLETTRYLSLVRQLIRELGSRNAAADALGVSRSYLSKLQGDLSRDVGLEALNRAKEALGLPQEYFEDESLGDDPDYRSFRSPGALVAGDGEQLRALQDFLESFDPDDPRRPDDEEVTWLEGHSFRELRAAGLEVTPSLYDRLLRERRAQQAGKLRPAPTVEPPKPRAGRRKITRR